MTLQRLRHCALVGLALLGHQELRQLGEQIRLTRQLRPDVLAADSTVASVGQRLDREVETVMERGKRREVVAGQQQRQDLAAPIRELDEAEMVELGLSD